MARRNPLQKVPDRISDRFTKVLEAADRSKAVPFGEEEVSPTEFRSRYTKMSEFERQQILDKPDGQAEMLKALRGGK